MGELYATITNGNGYTRPETDRFKDYAVRLTLTPLARAEGFLQTLSLNGFVDAGTKASALNVAPAGQHSTASDGAPTRRCATDASPPSSTTPASATATTC